MSVWETIGFGLIDVVSWVVTCVVICFAECSLRRLLQLRAWASVAWWDFLWFLIWALAGLWFEGEVLGVF